MIAFWSAAGLLAAGGLAFLVPPLWRGERIAALALAVAFPLCAAGLYAIVGTPAAVSPEAPAAAAPHAMGPEQIGAMVARLAARMRENPEDANGWTVLGRSYAVLGRFQDSAHAFERAIERRPADANLLADAADVLAMAQGKRLQGRPEALIERALAADPNHVKALALSGTAAFEKGDYAEAAARWRRILDLVPPDSDAARSARGSIADAERRGNKSR
jgi:cytochrome c-type biogenesis protein CcmH